MANTKTAYRRLTRDIKKNAKAIEYTLTRIGQGAWTPEYCFERILDLSNEIAGLGGELENLAHDDLKHPAGF